MTEDRLQHVERDLAAADAAAAAAVAFAAIHRMGEIGKAAGDAFALLANGADEDPDMSAVRNGFILIGLFPPSPDVPTPAEEAAA